MNGSASDASWVKRYTIRWPRLKVLRLEAVFAAAALTSVFAYVAAPWSAETPQHLTSPTIYVQFWFLLSSAVSLLWCLDQWYSRRSLPRMVSLGPWWYPGTSVVIVALLQSAVPVAAWAANRHVRLQRDEQAVEQDIDYFHRCAELATESGIPPREYGRLRFYNHRALLELVAQRTLHLGGAKSDGDVCKKSEASLTVYVSADAWANMARCLDRPGEIERVKSCLGNYSKEENDCEAHFFDRKAPCNVGSVGAAIETNMGILARSHLIHEKYSFVDDPASMKSVSAFVLAVGMFASCAGVMSLWTAAAGFVGLWVLGVAVGPAFRNFLRACGRAPEDIRNDWIVFGAVAYVVLSLVVLYSVLRRKPERNTRHDAGVMSVLLFPLFFLHVLSSETYRTGSMDDWDWLIQVHLWGCGAALVVGFPVGLLLSHYRRLASSA